MEWVAGHPELQKTSWTGPGVGHANQKWLPVASWRPCEAQGGCSQMVEYVDIEDMDTEGPTVAQFNISPSPQIKILNFKNWMTTLF